MATPALAETETFELWHCSDCKRQVLGYFDLDVDDSDILRCLHCDGRLDGTVKNVDGAELLAAGYSVVEARTCGNGGGCSTGGCGSR